MSDIDKIRQEIDFLKELNEGLYTEGDNSYYEGQDNGYNHILVFIDSLPEEKPSEDLEEAAQDYAILPMDVGDGRVCIDKKEERAFIAGAKWMESQMPMLEDTVIFMKGVAEGRRLEREDRNNDKLPRFYGD